MTEGTPPGGQGAEAQVWQFLRSIAAGTLEGAEDRQGGLDLVLGDGIVHVDPASGSLRGTATLPAEARQMLELCLPLCVDAQDSFVYAHLGQSLDGQIATASGASQYVTSPENLTHMHRMRALADAVVVGAGTVQRDDPRLTTRLVPGKNPVRVVIDPNLRLPADRRIFRDGAARTLVVCRSGRPKPPRLDGLVEIVEVESPFAEIAPAAVVAALQARGLRRLFVEGGGVTVSRFLGARALDRLHVTVCPVFIGRGRPGVVLPGVDSMDQTLRPLARRYLLGEDVLFDCALERARTPSRHGRSP